MSLMNNRCVICDSPIPEGRHICQTCEKAEEYVRTPFPAQLCEIALPPKANVELSFGMESGPNFLITYRRAKPLNRFQIWMFKVCFGICARNI